jgi:hypothetical protein
MLWLLGLSDDYGSDGSVVSQVLSDPSPALAGTASLTAAYHAINSSVGPLATATLQADSRALASGSAGHDSRYADTQAALQKIADRRDRLATEMKAALGAAAAGHPVDTGTRTELIARARNLLWKAEQLG